MELKCSANHTKNTGIAKTPAMPMIGTNESLKLFIIFPFPFWLSCVLQRYIPWVLGKGCERFFLAGEIKTVIPAEAGI